jgi:hypothetical protein
VRLQEISINPKTLKIVVDIMGKNTSFAIVVCNGIAKKVELPDYGETKIVTHQGKVKRVKFDEGEDF